MHGIVETGKLLLPLELRACQKDGHYIIILKVALQIGYIIFASRPLAKTEGLTLSTRAHLTHISQSRGLRQ